MPVPGPKAKTRWSYKYPLGNENWGPYPVLGPILKWVQLISEPLLCPVSSFVPFLSKVFSKMIAFAEWCCLIMSKAITDKDLWYDSFWGLLLNFAVLEAPKKLQKIVQRGSLTLHPASPNGKILRSLGIFSNLEINIGTIRLTRL